MRKIRKYLGANAGRINIINKNEINNLPGRPLIILTIALIFINIIYAGLLLDANKVGLRPFLTLAPEKDAIKIRPAKKNEERDQILIKFKNMGRSLVHIKQFTLIINGVASQPTIEGYELIPGDSITQTFDLRPPGKIFKFDEIIFELKVEYRIENWLPSWMNKVYTFKTKETFKIIIDDKGEYQIKDRATLRLKNH